MNIKAVIWDIGGVINRTEDPRPRDELAAELGVTRDRLNGLFFSGPEGTRAQKGEITVAELLANIRRELSLVDGQSPDLVDRFFGGDILDDALMDEIRRLRPAYKTGIISNAWPGLPALLNEWGIADAFDFVVGSGDAGVMKPDPRIYQMSLQGLGVQPGEAVFIDDFIENVQGAEALGFHAIHFKDRAQTLEELGRLLAGGESKELVSSEK
jgi:epoxide hydrolase-like predicted phosphatase